MATTKQTKAEPPVPDLQVETTAGETYEILTEHPNGHRTVHRVRASDRGAAEKAVHLDEGVRVLGVSAAGCGLGSG